MGNTPTTERLQHLTNLGFTVAESRAALRHTDGDVEKAAAILQRLRRQKAARANSAAGLVDRVNDLLREQKPWSEFFEKFLWPEHLDERLQTNLLYYRANYLVVTGGVVIVALLLQPALLLCAVLCSVLIVGAAAFTEPVPGLDAPLALPQRLAVGCLGAAWVVNATGHAPAVARICVVATGLTLAHATFRARTMASRWHNFVQDLKTD